ncbi:hypothetical protein MUK42_35154 [Musa troglodytarum]|nr:hypothetical protein MUK42_35154 [Musa troglodytarum]
MGGRQRRSGEKSSFNVACGLLSQYIKERSSVADLGGGWHRHLRMRRKGIRRHLGPGPPRSSYPARA